MQTPGRAGCPPRRTFLAGLAALGADALLSGDGSAAQTRAAAPHRIDVHNHLGPPSYIAEMGKAVPRVMQEWTPAKAIEDLDTAAVATSIPPTSPPARRLGETSTTRRLPR